jgi:hypothetical protein
VLGRGLGRFWHGSIFSKRRSLHQTQGDSNTLFSTPSDLFAFQIGAPGVTAANVYYEGIPLPAENLGWAPLDAEISAETQTLADQMPGDINHPLTFSNAGFVVAGSTIWFAMDQGTGKTYIGTGSNTGGGTPVEYGFWEPTGSTNQLNIFDIGCPTSVNSGNVLSVNGALDDAGSEPGTANSLVSGSGTNGPYSLEDQLDGNLVLYDARGYALWSPGIPSLTNYLSMQDDDNLVLYDGWGKEALWSSGTSGQGYSSPFARVQSDGNFVVYGNSTHSLWTSNTNWDSTNSGLLYGQSMAEGRTITSNTNGYYLSMQTDCNLVLYNSAHQWLWQTSTSGDGSACHADMQTDGNFVLYRYAGASDPLKWTGTSGTGSTDHLVVGSTGNFSVDNVAGTTLYTS